MDNNEVKILIDAFLGYRDLLAPIQENLNAFAGTYDMLKNDIEKLNTAFSGDVKGNLEKIYQNLSAQADKATDLSSRIEQFIKMTNKYTSDVTKLAATVEKVVERIETVNALEQKAEEQIGKLDAIIEEKRKSYNLRELQKNLESYNDSVQKVSEFINKDVAEALNQNSKKLDGIRTGNENLTKRIEEENGGVIKLLEGYKQTETALKMLADKEDVNEEYLFDILDKWAAKRRIKAKK